MSASVARIGETENPEPGNRRTWDWTWRCDWREWFTPRQYNWLTFTICHIEVERQPYLGDGSWEVTCMVAGLGFTLNTWRSLDRELALNPLKTMMRDIMGDDEEAA